MTKRRNKEFEEVCSLARMRSLVALFEMVIEGGTTSIFHRQPWGPVVKRKVNQ
jgi:hypothetical protein